MHRLDTFLIEKILFHPQAKGILFDFFHNFTELRETLKICTAGECFLFYKPFLDVLLYQSDSSVVKVIYERCQESFLEFISKQDIMFMEEFISYFEEYLNNEEIDNKHLFQLYEDLYQIYDNNFEEFQKNNPDYFRKEE